MKEMKGAFSLNNLLVGTVRPPEKTKKKTKNLAKTAIVTT